MFCYRCSLVSFVSRLLALLSLLSSLHHPLSSPPLIPPTLISTHLISTRSRSPLAIGFGDDHHPLFIISYHNPLSPIPLTLMFTPRFSTHLISTHSRSPLAIGFGEDGLEFAPGPYGATGPARETSRLTTNSNNNNNNTNSNR